LIGRLATDPKARNTFRLKTDELRRLAQEVRADVFKHERTDSEFLERIAKELRDMAVTCRDEAIKSELFAMAADMELQARLNDKR
jgi:hypothetical protein